MKHDVTRPRGPSIIARADTTDTLAAQLASITTDTGAFAPGHKDFAHYDTPGLCLAAAKNISALMHHSLEAQLLADTLERDTVGLGATAGFAKRCGSRFALNNSPPNERWFLFLLATFEQNDTLTEAVMPSLEHDEVSDTYPIGRLWYDAFQWLYYHGRLASAESLMNRVHAAGPQEQQVYHLMRDDWRKALIRGRSDTVGQRKDAEWWIANGKSRQDVPRDYPNTLNAYWTLMRLAVIEDTTQLPMLAEHAKHDLSLFSLVDQNKTQMCELQRKTCGSWETFSVDTIISRLAPDWYSIPKYNRTMATALTADAWASPPGYSPTDTVVPVKGKMNLICQASLVNDDPTWLMVGRHYQEAEIGNAWRQADMIHQYLSQYGKDGLEITLVHSEDGFENISKQNWQFYLYDSVPTRALDVWRWYDQGYHENPVHEAIQFKKTTRWLPEPDGRRFDVAQTPFELYGRDVFPYKKIVSDVYKPTMGGWVPISGEEPGYCALVGRTGELIDVKHAGVSQWDDILAWYLTGLGKVRGINNGTLGK